MSLSSLPVSCQKPNHFISLSSSSLFLSRSHSQKYKDLCLCWEFEADVLFINLNCRHSKQARIWRIAGNVCFEDEVGMVKGVGGVEGMNWGNLCAMCFWNPSLFYLSRKTPHEVISQTNPSLYSRAHCKWWWKYKKCFCNWCGFNRILVFIAQRVLTKFTIYTYFVFDLIKF